jgi:hypothetical protein
LVHAEISPIVARPVVDLHVPEVVYLFPFLCLGCNVIAGRNLEDLIHTKIVVWKVFQLIGFLVKLVQKTRVQDLTYGLLGTGPAVLNVLKLRNYFAHLFPVNTYVLVKELLNTIGTEIQKYRQFLEFVIIRGLIDMNHIREHFRESGKNIRVEPPFDFGQKVSKYGELVHVDEHFFAYPT